MEKQDEEQKRVRMTLQGYYESLPAKCSPRNDFVLRIATECGVSVSSVLNWVRGMRPKQKCNIEVISRITGIPEDELFN